MGMTSMRTCLARCHKQFYHNRCWKPHLLRTRFGSEIKDKHKSPDQSDLLEKKNENKHGCNKGEGFHISVQLSESFTDRSPQSKID